MPGSPHPLALFSLVPWEGNKLAKSAISDPKNGHCLSRLPDSQLALDVRFRLLEDSPETLATLGRGLDADIHISGSSIAKVQCSFEIDLNTGIVMLYDRSYDSTTRVFGKKFATFELGRTRKVLVYKDFNPIIEMGCDAGNLVQFELIWHRSLMETKEITKDHIMRGSRVGNPYLALTERTSWFGDGTSSRCLPYHGLQTIRYLPLGHLGSGSYGTVYRAVDVDTGKVMAVKIIDPKIGKPPQKWREDLQKIKSREVNSLSKISHPNIVDYIASQGFDGPQPEIFMGLKEGNLESLVLSSVDATSIARSLTPQILKALDHIAWKGIIHRDVKPQNILYTTQPSGEYQFQLADFGLCNYIKRSVSQSGTPIYMAPEIFYGGNQTDKVDVWSLFVTILYALDFGAFRQNCEHYTSSQIYGDIVPSAASSSNFSQIQEMAFIDPKERASAAQMLIKHYGGEGLTTPRNHVPELHTARFPAKSSVELTRAKLNFRHRESET